MHIPDGFVAPSLYIPAYLSCVPLWLFSFKRFFKVYEENFSKILLLSTFGMVAQNIQIPLPMSTSAHAIGTYAIGMVYGPTTAFLCETIILLISMMLKGGMTVLPINALALGFLGPLGAYLLYRYLPDFKLKPFVSAYIGALVSASVIATFLSLQYLLDPTYFSISPKALLPALLLPHLLFIGPAEGIYTTLVVKSLEKLR